MQIREEAMAAIDELIEQIDNPVLRERIAAEVQRVVKQKKFGLVFEEHLPERTLLYEVPVKRGSLAARNSDTNDLYQVIEIADDKAICISKASKEQKEIPVSELVSAAEFGEPIYPYLEPLDSVENAPDSGLWHTLIEADNYHALQLLDYMYHGKVDCIYIDPPYNTGARDWKYNNNYVDGNDQYRHSKWLSMMKKRLLLAKKLLNQNDSVLIVTIDEKEYLHLGCLLEELFPEANIQMISTLISPQGNQRKNQFSRLDEYIFFVEFGQASVQKLPLGDEWRINAKDKRTTHLHWQQLIRNGSNGTRQYSPNLFYPIYVSKDGKKFLKAGEPLPLEQNRNSIVPPNDIPDDAIPIWPLHSDGSEGRWACSHKKLEELQAKGYVKLGQLKNDSMYITYLQKGMIEKVENGDFIIDGYNEDGSIISNNEFRSFVPGSQWRIPSHDASRHGSTLLQKILCDNRFSFPKSCYAVRDAIRFFVANKPDALIVDFFAGSGTTLHALNLLNAEDDGNRRCILVTNNEVSDAEVKSLTEKGYKPGDKEWDSLGIARYVTWPRTVCSIEGHDIKGEPLKGNYLDNNRPMSDGFHTNAKFFKLGFLDKNSIAYGTQLEKLLPVLWMKAGAYAKCPTESISDKFMIYPENKFAILVNTKYAYEFKQELPENIEVAYIITDYEPEYHDIANSLKVNTTYHLYRDYLDNFTINTGRI